MPSIKAQDPDGSRFNRRLSVRGRYSVDEAAPASEVRRLTGAAGKPSGTPLPAAAR
jgi:hypothetical protein